VPDGEDLFHGDKAKESPDPYPENSTQRSFCLCNDTDNGNGSDTDVCDRKAVSDTTAEKSEPQKNVRLGVPLVPTTKRRRRRRQASGLSDESPTSNARTYPTFYE